MHVYTCSVLPPLIRPLYYSSSCMCLISFIINSIYSYICNYMYNVHVHLATALTFYQLHMTTHVHIHVPYTRVYMHVHV